MNIERTSRNTLIGLGLVLLGILALSAMAGGMGYGFQGGDYGARHFMASGPWFWGLGLIGMVVRLAIWGGLILLAVGMFRRWSGRRWDWDAGHSDVRHAELSPIEILRRRYAAGEITREQFEEMRRVLEPEAR